MTRAELINATLEAMEAAYAEAGEEGDFDAARLHYESCPLED